MEYGTYQLQLYRVWNVKAQSYIHGIAGTRQHVETRFRDWICNEFCDGWSPFVKPSNPIDNPPDDTMAKYRRARRGYRIVPVKVRIADDWQNVGRMSAVVI